jgi:hypothetical protein
VRCGYDVCATQIISRVALKLNTTGNETNRIWQDLMGDAFDKCREASEKLDQVVAYDECAPYTAKAIILGPEKVTLYCFYPERYGGRRRPESEYPRNILRDGDVVEDRTLAIS